MNKRGITLVEVVVSIGLISVVMLFLFNLLIDMQFEEDHASFSKKNQVARASIIKLIQNDFMNLNLTDAIQNKSQGRVEITLTYATLSKQIVVTQKNINYNNEEVWDIADENATFDLANISIKKINPSETCSKVDNPNTGKEENVCSKYQTIKIMIPVVTGEKENIIDDIELFYLGRTI